MRGANDLNNEDITILADPEKNLRLIMKDGEIFKNTTVPVSDPTYRPAPEMRITPGKVKRGGSSL